MTATKLLALFSYNTGFSVKRAEEYLNELIELGMVELVDGEIHMVRAKNREEEVTER